MPRVVPEWVDDRTLPRRMKSGARHAVREIFVCIALVTVALVLVDTNHQKNPQWLGEFAGAFFFFGWWLGIAAWAIYRILRFAIGR